ncbi:MAG: O-antigen ligase family protein [Suipraeoptans sp.]
MKENIRKIMPKIETTFKIIYLLLAFSTFNTYIYLSPIQRILVWVCIGAGIVTILLRLIFYKNYIKMPLWWLLAAFLVSFIISIIMNSRFGTMGADLKWVIWSGLMFFMLYVSNTNVKREHYKIEFKLLANIMVIYSAIAAIISFILMLIIESNITVTDSGETLISGFTWGRLWGVYTDPNYGGAFSAICIILSIYFIINNKNKLIRASYIIALVFNYIYIIFSDSRTAELSVIIGIVGFVLIYHSIKKTSLKKRIMYISIAIVISGVSLLSNSIIKKEYNEYVQKVIVKLEQTDKAKADKKKEQKVGRSKDLESDASNGRVALWESGIEVWKHTPIFGTGYNSFTAAAKEYEPDTYVVNNDQGEYTSLHNAYINVLVYQGVIGFAIVLVFMILMVVFILRRIKNVPKEDASYIATMMVSVIIVATSMMLLLEGIYTNSPGSIVLWGFSGYLVQYFFKQEGKHDKRQKRVE